MKRFYSFISLAAISLLMSFSAAAQLTFTYSPAFNIPASTVGTPIADIDVSGGVSGGTTPYTFSVSGVFPLPAGISINTTTGVISGTPTAAAAGTLGGAEIFVTDATSATESIVINYGYVSAASLTFMQSPAYDIPASTVGTPITPIDISGGASGGMPPYTFSVSLVYPLPAGISISPAGVISGTPTAEAAAGTAVITVADNASGASQGVVQNATAIFRLHYGAITAAPAPPPVTPPEPMRPVVQRLITVAPTANGTVVSSTRYAPTLWVVTLVVTPAPGFALDSLWILPTIPTAYTPTEPLIPVGDGTTFTFKMQPFEVTVYALFSNATAVEDVQASALQAYTRNGTLYINGLTAGAEWSVYNITGTLIYQSVANNEQAEVVLRGRGVYIVRSGNSVVKVSN
jgi:hypothetical protein